MVSGWPTVGAGTKGWLWHELTQERKAACLGCGEAELGKLGAVGIALRV